MNFKDKLLTSLGWVGIILWYILGFLFISIPLAATNFPPLVRLILLVLILCTDFIGAIVSVFVYGYGAYVVFHEPFSAFTVIFFIFFAVYTIFFLLPSVIKILSAARSSK